MNQALSVNKTAQTITFILQLHQKPMVLNRLLKMIYFIDRLYLALANRSLTNDNYKCLTSGLIPQNIPGLISQLRFIEILAPGNLNLKYISLNQNAKIDSLSNLEREIIAEVYHQKKDLDPLSLRDWNYDSWFITNHLKHKGNNLFKPTDIMLSLKKTKAEILSYHNHQIQEQRQANSAYALDSDATIYPKIA